jgi:hypothetical protein
MASRLLGLYPRILSPTGSLLATTRPRFVQCVPFSTTADKNGVQVTKTATSEPGSDEAKPKRRRRRTAFGADGVASLPSFEEFQQQVAIRTLYRQFLRLVRPLRDSSPEIGQIDANFAFGSRLVAGQTGLVRRRSSLQGTSSHVGKYANYQQRRQ